METPKNLEIATSFDNVGSHWFVSHKLIIDFPTHSKAFFQAAYDIEPYETIEGDLLYEVPKQLFENCEKLELRISVNKNKIDEVYIIDLTSEEI